jgi:hypothetical protein
MPKSMYNFKGSHLPRCIVTSVISTAAAPALTCSASNFKCGKDQAHFVGARGRAAKLAKR